MVTIPKLKDLEVAIRKDMEGKLSVVINTLGKSFLLALSQVQAAKHKLIYLALGNVQKNTWPDNADSEADGGTLERFGRSKLGRNPNQATSGVYDVQVTGTIGTMIPGSTTFKSDDNSTSPGQLFILDNDFELVTGFDLIPLRALTPGNAAKLIVGDTLTATSPILLADSIVTVQDVTTQPIDAEDLEDYRAKIDLSFRLEPQGGADTDYILWSQDAAGVAKVYPYVKPDAYNEINLYVEAVVSDSYDGTGTPTQSILEAVKAVVDFSPDETLPLLSRGRKPMGVFVNYLPVGIKYVNVSVIGSDFTTDEKSIVSLAITEYLATIRPFIAGADIVANKKDILNVTNLINVVLLSLPTAIFDSIVLNINSVPVSSYLFDDGNIPFDIGTTYP